MAWPNASSSNLLMVSGQPLELLIQIFQFTIRSSDLEIKTATQLSGVSKRWRNIILAVTELWEWIDCLNPSLTALCIERAGARKLSFSSQGARLSGNNVILRHILRVKALDLLSTAPTQLQHIGNWIIPAPHLESCNLTRFSLPTKLFHGLLPCLNHLSLDNCLFSWESIPRCPRLQHLSIRHPKEPTKPTTFLKFLAMNPNLKFLEVAGIFRGNILGLSQIIGLHKLETLVVESAKCHHIIHILQHLSIPSTTNVSMNLQQHTPRDHEDTFEALQRSRPSSTITAKTVTVVVEAWLSFQIVEPGDNFVNLTFWPPNRKVPLFIGLFGFINLHQLESFDLNGKITPPIGLWILFQELPNLRILKVRNPFARSFLEYVKTKMDNTIVTPFPHLQELLYEEHGLRSVEFNAALLQLAEYLQSRAGISFAVTSLTVVGSDRMLYATEQTLLKSVQNLDHVMRGQKYGIPLRLK